MHSEITGASTSNNTQSAGIWNPITGSYVNVPGLTHTDHRNQAAAVMLPPAQLQQFVVMGGGSSNGTAAIADTNFVDLSTSNPHYVSGPPLAAAKGFVSGLSEREAGHIAFFDLTFAGRTDDEPPALGPQSPYAPNADAGAISPWRGHRR